MPLDILIEASDIRPYAQISILLKQEDQLHPYILSAQNLDIKPVLGNAFWTDLLTNRTLEKYKALLDGGTYTKDGETLSYAGLKAAIASYAYARYVIGKNVQDTPFGMQVKESDYSSQPSQKLLAQNSSNHSMAGQQYLAEVIDFLNENLTTYDKFNSCKADKSKSKGTIRMTGASKEFR